MADDVEVLTPDNPPPAADDPSVPQFAEDAGGKGKVLSFAERRRAFFNDLEDSTVGEVTDDEPDEVAAPEPSKQPVKARLATLGEKVAAAAEPTAAELVEQATADAVGDDTGEGGGTGAETPAAETQGSDAQEFRTADGLRYRAIGPKGELFDPLSEFSGHNLEVFFDGKWHGVPVEKLPAYLGNALLFNRQQKTLAESRQQLQQREAQLAEREAEIDRFFSDAEYRRAVEAELDKLQTPEGQLELREQELRQERQQRQGRELQEATQVVQTHVVEPVLAQLVKDNPLVGENMIGAMYASALTRFPPGALKVVRQRDGFYPVNPTAWAEFTRLLQEELPAGVAAEQQRLAALATPKNGDEPKQQGKPSKEDVAARKSKADQEAALVRGELAKNRVATRTSQSAGLPPNREKPKQRITTIQGAKKWLADH